MKNAKFLLKKYSPLILTSLGSVGVVVTSVLTAKGTIQAKKLVEIDSANSQLFTDDGKAKLETIKATYKASGATCTEE